jgi:hypothetical protein
MFRIYFVNFGYYSQNEGTDIEDAKRLCKKAGFQSTVVEKETGKTIASWCPISGWRLVDRSYAA